MSLPSRAPHPDGPKKAPFLRSPLNPAAEVALRNIGRAVEPLFHAEDPGVCRDARGLFRRVVPDTTKNQHLLDAVPKLVASLLDSLERLGPTYEVQRNAITDAWFEVERASES
jgi:hypothetical protein